MLNLSSHHAPVAGILAEELERVTVIFERQLASELSAVNALTLHVERYRGKMLRPSLVVLMGMAAGSPAGDRGNITETHRIVAAVVEMIHMATLVHDDILDDATTRRGGVTVNELCGNEMAVMLGDYLISNSFHLCSTAGDPAINLALGEVTNTLCGGELVQLHHREDYTIDEATYLAIVTRKTASLIAECCRQGAQLAGASDDVAQAMHAAGEALGIAFQIQDDLLDLTGDESTVGKTLGKDLDKGKLTLPVIYHLEGCDAMQRGEALRCIQSRDAVGLLNAMRTSGAIERSLATAQRLVDGAKTLILDHLDDSPARDLLASLSDAVITRKA